MSNYAEGGTNSEFREAKSLTDMQSVTETGKAFRAENTIHE